MLPDWEWWLVGYAAMGWLFIETCARGNPDVPPVALVLWGFVLWPVTLVTAIVRGITKRRSP